MRISSFPKGPTSDWENNGPSNIGGMKFYGLTICADPVSEGEVERVLERWRNPNGVPVIL